jgi:hypothetical protein
MIVLGCVKKHKTIIKGTKIDVKKCANKYKNGFNNIQNKQKIYNKLLKFTKLIQWILISRIRLIEFLYPCIMKILIRTE